MSIRTISYAVTASGISPATAQAAGIKGEHRATQLVFNLDQGLFNELTAAASGKSLVYRIDSYDSQGGGDTGDTAALTGNQIFYSVDEKLTHCGGMARVYLIISVVNDDNSEMVLYSFPAVLRFTSTPENDHEMDEIRADVSALLTAAKAAAISAGDSQTAATLSKLAAQLAEAHTQEAKAVLESGCEFVFDCGDGENSFPVDYVVDSVMSDVSQNAAQNKVIKQYVDEKTVVDGALSDTGTNAVQNKVVKSAIEHINPLGTALDYFGATVPSGYAFCDGRALSKTAYPNLFGVLGYVYGGSGDYFNIPDLRERVTVGYKSDSTYFNEIGKKLGESEQKITVPQLPPHSHDYTINIQHNGDATTEESLICDIQQGGYARYFAITKEAGEGAPISIIQQSFVCHKIMRIE